MKREHFISNLKYHKALVTWLGIYAKEGSAATEAVMIRPLANDTSSEGTLRIMKKWIKTCVDRHEKYQWGYNQKELALAGPDKEEGLGWKQNTMRTV